VRLGDLDDRFASSGPLGLVRDVPQLGLLLVVTVFLAGVLVARSSDEAQSTRQRGDADPAALGPAVGASIDEHFSTARERAVGVAATDPETRFTALVSLSDERTPAQVQQLLAASDLTARRIYLRAPDSGELPEVVAVEAPGDVVAAARPVYEQTARRKLEEQREFESLASSIEPVTEEEAGFKTFYEAAARSAGAEAAAYGSGCSCVFAVVVAGPAGRLAELTGSPGVRGVEFAARGARLSMLDVFPLPPDATGVVEAPAPTPGR
jgi:hypothetical protein